jgi:hypothetical protein
LKVVLIALGIEAISFFWIPAFAGITEKDLAKSLTKARF